MAPAPASREELEALFRGYGYVPLVADIRRIQRKASTNGFTVRPRWPLIILRSPKGWTGPKVVDRK
jgi:xylulose-5-phosphate/fructose-6-phosphate phosphoketolase